MNHSDQPRTTSTGREEPARTRHPARHAAATAQRRSQPGRPCSCGRRWAPRPRRGRLPEVGGAHGHQVQVTTAALIDLLRDRDELRGTSVLADHMGEAVTWGV